MTSTSVPPETATRIAARYDDASFNASMALTGPAPILRSKSIPAALTLVSKQEYEAAQDVEAEDTNRLLFGDGRRDSK